MFYVYVLSLKNGQLYVGRSDDLKRRIREHSAGKVRSTRSRRPAQLVFYEAFTMKADAIRRERYLKSSKGKSTIRMTLSGTLDAF